jgi:VWFA-related protein
LAGRLTVVPGANITILFDALVEACGAFTRDMERRAIFVVSDGIDTGSDASARVVMQRAAEMNVVIYAVGLSSRSIARGRSTLRAPDATLLDIAEDTGGRYMHLGAARDFKTVFASMIAELHDQYMLGFTPTHVDGRLHSLQVTTRRPNVRLRARKHYVAGTPKSTGP